MGGPPVIPLSVGRGVGGSSMTCVVCSNQAVLDLAKLILRFGLCNVAACRYWPSSSMAVRGVARKDLQLEPATLSAQAP